MHRADLNGQSNVWVSCPVIQTQLLRLASAASSFGSSGASATGAATSALASAASVGCLVLWPMVSQPGLPTKKMLVNYGNIPDIANDK